MLRRRRQRPRNMRHQKGSTGFSCTGRAGESCEGRKRAMWFRVTSAKVAAPFARSRCLDLCMLVPAFIRAHSPYSNQSPARCKETMPARVEGQRAAHWKALRVHGRMTACDMNVDGATMELWATQLVLSLGQFIFLHCDYSPLRQIV